MDVYTEPPSNIYITGKLFKFPCEGGDVLAISVSNSFALLLSAVYAILTIYLSTALWNVLVYVVMLTARQERAMAWNLVLSIFWNSAEPVVAFSNLFTTSNRLLRRDSSSGLKDPSVRLGIKLMIFSFLIAGGSITGGILIPSQLSLGSVAPVNPISVYIPGTATQQSMGTSIRMGMLNKPATIRALGSAEASKVTLRNRVHVYQEGTDASTDNKPDFTIKYSYNFTGVELGLPHSLGLFHTVKGKCWTDYSWLRHEPGNSTLKMDYYDHWNLGNNKSQSFVHGANSLNVNHQLGVTGAVHPDLVADADLVANPPSNMSYAILYSTAHLASTTESNDAMYQTELMPTSYPLRNIYPFRIRAERPALSCWQSSEFCVHGQCNSLNDIAKKNPPTLPPATILTLSRIATPVIVRITNAMGPSSLMSFYGPQPGSSVDAGGSSAIADFERMIMGAYLLSRNLFRDTAMATPVDGFTNMILNAKNQPHEGTGNFVIESGLVTALSFWWLVALPTAAVLLFLVGVILGGMVRSVGEGNLRVRPAQRERMVALSMGQLFRRASWRGEEFWTKRFANRMIPVPVDDKEELGWDSKETNEVEKMDTV
ncbi:hypothetical protein B0J11DRAFT_570424 [Dendryphion nanum]|uniref:Uncharacterized protein n=1 Tax=Dendryphion nanum TaxID=256645 RepID=A0A9P9IFF8_9PLEO|nr:hypothetical protein B0J11DRAFT_570424 [Dendryphion nanum]